MLLQTVTSCQFTGFSLFCLSGAPRTHAVVISVVVIFIVFLVVVGLIFRTYLNLTSKSISSSFVPLTRLSPPDRKTMLVRRKGKGKFQSFMLMFPDVLLYRTKNQCENEYDRIQLEVFAPIEVHRTLHGGKGGSAEGKQTAGDAPHRRRRR